MAWVTPITHAVGDAITVSDFNQFTRDNTNFLYGDAAWTSVPVFTNGWVAGTPVPQYRLAGGLVVLRGVTTGGTSGASAFTLGVGYRSAVDLMFSVASVGVFTDSQAQLPASGVVGPFLNTGATGIHLDGIVYSVL